jgi:hypothetical protein
MRATSCCIFLPAPLLLAGVARAEPVALSAPQMAEITAGGAQPGIARLVVGALAGARSSLRTSGGAGGAVDTGSNNRGAFNTGSNNRGAFNSGDNNHGAFNGGDGNNNGGS